MLDIFSGGSELRSHRELIEQFSSLIEAIETLSACAQTRVSCAQLVRIFRRLRPGFKPKIARGGSVLQRR